MRLLPVRAVTCFALVFALVGCPKQGEPSPAYSQAQDEFNALYGRHVEDSYLMPEMDPIEEKLASVPEKSSDYARAQELLKRIRSGRERVEAENESRREAMEKAVKPQDDFEFQPGETPEEPAEPEAPKPAAATDAGQPEHPVAGMDAAEIQKRWSDCFVSGPDIQVAMKGTRSTFDLRDTLFCRQKHPGFESQLVVLEAGKVLAVVQKKDLKDLAPPPPPAPAPKPTEPSPADAG